MRTEILDPTGFPLEEHDPLAPFHHRINAYLRSLPNSALVRYWWNGKTDWDKVRAAYKEASLPLLELSVEEQLGCIRACARFSHWFRFERGLRLPGQKPSMDDQMAYERALNSLCSHILKQEREWSEEEVCEIVEIDIPYGFWWERTEAVSPLLETYLQRHPLTGSLRASVEVVREWNAHPHRIAYWASLGAILGEPLVLHRGEKWADEAIAFISGQSEIAQEQWRQLLLMCSDSDKAKPSQKWLKAAQTLIEAIGVNAFAGAFDEWSLEFGQSTQAYEINQVTFKGLVWCASLTPIPQVASALTRVALFATKPTPMDGRTPTLNLFNASVWSLGQLDHPGAKERLLELQKQVKGGRLKSVERALAVVAARS